MSLAKFFQTEAARSTDELRDLISKMPDKGDTEQDSQKICVLNALNGLEQAINGVTDEDFER